MAKYKNKAPKVVYQSIWSKKTTKNEKWVAQQNIDDIFDYIFRKTLEDSRNKPI